MTTLAQQWQQARFRVKGTLSAARTQFRNLLDPGPLDNVLTYHEREELYIAVQKLDRLLNYFDQQNASSKENFLSWNSSQSRSGSAD